MRRTLLVLALVAILVVATAMPAFAKLHFDSNSQSDCNSGRGNGTEGLVFDCDPSSSGRPKTG
jgi:hypothetical protein